MHPSITTSTTLHDCALRTLQAQISHGLYSAEHSCHMGHNSDVVQFSVGLAAMQGV